MGGTFFALAFLAFTSLTTGAALGPEAAGGLRAPGYRASGASGACRRPLLRCC